ncbi:thiopeptide-type bacteriocin biosynthesis protein [Streptomyces griseochromogenes]|uniref:thiopeptide-type bacteriocin biosynthesis protein n=1 Tax=Streptomyces griseochromogenes TaxID=68214 RepID=UPI00379AA5FF
MPLLPHTAVGAVARSGTGIDPRDRADAERYLAALTADERIREALAISSPSLDRALRGLLDGAPMKPAAVRKLVLGVTRYVLRAAARPTPFGLLAGIAPVSFADGCRIRVGDAHRAAVRPDSGWLLGLVRPWESESALLRKLRVVAHDLGFRRGSRWVLPVSPAPDESDASASRTEEVSVRLTGPVRLVLERARSPLPAGELAALLAEAYPTAGSAVVERLIADLVRQGFLLTELRPPLTRTDPLRHVHDVLVSVAEWEKADTLARVAKLLDGLAAEPVGAGAARWHTAADRLRALHRHDRPLQVDLRMDTEVTLPAAVLREAERAAAALWRTAPKDDPVPHLTEYHTAFVERYGIGRAVALLDVLDPHTGLGTPAGYDRPGERGTQGGATGADPARDRVLAELALTALADGQREIVLDEATLDRLSRTVPQPAPNAAELCVQLTAESREAVAQDEFGLVVSQTTGSTAPGALLGRFAYLLDDGEPIARLAREGAASAARPGAEPVHLDFQPLTGGAANVARVPSYWAGRLAIGCFPDTAPGACLEAVGGTSPGISAGAPVRNARDIALAADDERLYAVDVATGRELVPQSATVLNFVLAPAAVRLLRELPAMGRPLWAAWSWGALGSTAPHLPRVRYGRTVLAAAHWKLSDPALTDARTGDEEWGRALDAWRARWKVPRHVSVGVLDRRVVLDLEAPLHRALLRRELAGGADPVAYETPEECGPGENWLRDTRGDAYRGELVLPVFPARPLAPEPASSDTVRPTASLDTVRPAASLDAVRPTASADAVRPAESADTVRPAESGDARSVLASTTGTLPPTGSADAPTPPLPGATSPSPVAGPTPLPATGAPVLLRSGQEDGRRHRAWFYGKLHTVPARQDEVLVEHLPRLLAALPDGGGRWFFIRYADPEPHLRLRFHGDPGQLWSRLAPVILDWADDLYEQRLAGRLVVDRYEPETVRYGGPGSLDAAERFFHHDSLTVLEQLGPLASGAVTAPPPVLAAAHYVDLVRQVHGEQWPEWFLRIPRDEQHQPYAHTHRSEVLGLLADDTALAPAARADRARALGAFPAASQRTVLASLLHMHHNRIAGIQRTAERRSLALARAVAEAERGDVRRQR